jgi:hypothetical protein
VEGLHASFLKLKSTGRTDNDTMPPKTLPAMQAHLPTFDYSFTVDSVLLVNLDVDVRKTVAVDSIHCKKRFTTTLAAQLVRTLATPS